MPLGAERLRGMGLSIAILSVVMSIAPLGGVGPAVSSETAVRGPSYQAGAVCDLSLVGALSSRHPDVDQFVVLATTTFADTDGIAFVAARDLGGDWICQTPSTPARFGRAGTRPLLDRRSGDGTTPAGVFPLGDVTAWDGQRFNVFGNEPDPGVRSGVGYRDVRPEDCWGAVDNTARFQHLVNAPGCSEPDEWLQRYGGVYAHAAVIGANLDPISGDAPGEVPYAAAIFLHRHSYASDGSTKPTSGCVSLPRNELADTIRLLDPSRQPHFAIGPVDYLRTTA